MLRFLPGYWLLAWLLLAALGLPGSEGWAGSALRGDRLMSEHGYLSAIAQYEAVARQPAGATVARERLGRAFLRRGQWQEAANLYQEAEAAGVPSREALLGLATALDRLGEGPASLAALRRTLSLRPTDAEAWTRLVEQAARAGMSPAEIADLVPRQPAPVGDRGWPQRVAYLLGGAVWGPDTGEGRAALDRAAAGGDGEVRALAFELLEAAREPDSGGRAIAIGRALLAQGLQGPALGYLAREQVDEAQLAEARALAAYALVRIGRLEEAEQVLGAAMAVAPDRPLSRFMLALVLRHRGDEEGALGLLQEAARSEPGNPAVQAELANVLIGLGDYGSAEQALRRAVAAAPTSAELRLAVAGFHVDRQYRVERALGDAEEAVRLTGRAPTALSTLGWALHLVGRSREARDLLAEAVARAPESALLRYRLGSVYEGLGEREQARAQLAMVRELDGSGEIWRRARAALED